ncbi:polyhydroxyalkanoate depolymerase [Bordetella holmesii]|uniref:Intracellular poly[D(-)-3-hydroxybutyrate] depolymerase n=2 Tax=Bordetella holmesii TaxID=35814 RepID=A0A158M2F2_9BORD|nr:polyhydroxyalkanoate depolymerase [Bordetella holmesii]AHV93136.1 polyhydroxyalkanoate depolymerase, intracellular family protein [Bordetella holmesii ATCC 51541]AIT26919.1 polyhydroxyalkanoate depolymerase, intracellular family protein [Bordetella holmesii 44057]EWM43530.1 polyhydroxyalkanoate depolymerase, intracellular family protein [Bordetella holmesii 41130]EWM47502.1 polyhydroxyalkanoate depolymerase, intracellular family protein [Bordetella holmesii 35009]EWM51667.1 polyhydroxyalkan
MLYELHEMQRAFLRPLAAFTDASSQLFSSPYSPLAYTPLSRQLAASCELIYRIGKEYQKPAWGLDSTTIDGRAVKVMEAVALDKPFCRLVHFQRDLRRTSAREDPRVLVVAPLSGHHATLLRDTVRALLPAHDVYVADWVDARMVPLSAGPFHLDDYVRYVQDFIRHLGPDLHVISVCQPTVPVLAAISLMASADEAVQPRSMVMMGGPIDPRESPTQVNNLATTKPYSWFESQLIHAVPLNYPGAGRKVYPGFLQHAGFMAMNPDRHLKSHYDFYLDLLRGDDSDAAAYRRFYDEYNAVLDMPAEFYLDTIRIVFQEFRLPEGSWQIDGQLVHPQAIKKTALLTIEGELDDISGQGQTRAAIKLCRGIPAARKTHYTVEGAGHYGIFSGRRWREQVCPKIAEFIRQA